MKEITVSDLVLLLTDLIKEKKIRPTAKIILSSDTEGNEHSYMEGYSVEGKDIILVPRHDRIQFEEAL